MTPEEKKEYNRLYHLKNKQRINARHNLHYHENKEVYHTATKEWKKKNPESLKLINQKARKKNSKLIREFVWFVKTYKCCSVCGFNNPAALHFHHVDKSTKKMEIALMLRHGFSMRAIKQEMKKCVILCANCHAIHHYKEKQSMP